MDGWVGSAIVGSVIVGDGDRSLLDRCVLWIKVVGEGKSVWQPGKTLTSPLFYS